jgi:hypothetical protein
MRGTLHIVTPRDFWAFTTARRELGAHYWPPSYERRLPQRKIAELAKAAVTELRSGPRRLEEVRALLEPHAVTGITPTFPWRRMQGHEHVVHVPPSGTCGYDGEGVYEAADSVIGGRPPAADEACEHMIRWTSTTARSTTCLMRPCRITRCPRRPGSCPGTTTSCSPMPIAGACSVTFPSLGSSRRTRSFTRRFDGFVAGTWQLENGRVRLEPFGRLARPVRAALAEELERVEAFVA